MTTVVNRACEIARDNHARRVQDIHLACGAMSGVVPDALAFCFDICTADTPAAGARLHIEHMPAAWRCNACGATTDHVNDYTVVCPSCQAASLELTAGRDFFLKSIVVE